MPEKKIGTAPKSATKVDKVDISLEDFPVLDISKAADLRDLLADALAKHQAISIDASAVERITSPCVQVLLSTAMLLEKNSLPFYLNPSEAMQEAFSLLGLSTTLEQWSGPNE